MEKRLIRSTSNVWIGGVCAGLADYIGWETDSFRLFYFFLSLFSAAFPGILVYALLWIFMPKE